MVKSPRSKPPLTAETPTQSDIARALNITPPMITKLKRLGMPVSSVSAARAWRDANLCLDGRRAELRFQKPGPPLSLVARVDQANALALSALSALKAGRFAEVEAELRLALRAVPDSHADRILMPFAILDRLTADVRQALDEMAAEEGVQADGADLSNEDAEWMGRFWMQVARGAVRIA